MINNFKVVRVKGLEPPRQRRQNLNLVRLPISPHPRGGSDSKRSLRGKEIIARQPLTRTRRAAQENSVR